MTSVWTRSGDAFQAGAPIGASVNIGQTTTDASQAKAAGSVFAQQTPSFITQPTTPWAQKQSPFAPSAGISTNTSTTPADGSTLADQGLSWFLHAINVPLERVQDYYRASFRYSAANSQGNLAGSFRSTLNFAAPVLGHLTNPELRALESDPTVNGSSFAQTWIATSLQHAGDAPGDYSLLDDPERQDEKNAYFGEGRMRFATGVMDAAFAVTMDPLIVAGGVTSSVKAARATLHADDVVKIADRSIDAANLSSKQRRARDIIDTLVDATEPGQLTNGTVSALARTKFLSQSTDGGAIAYLMGRANAMPEFVGNKAARLEFKRDLITAGMGDQTALARIGEKSNILQAEVYAIGEDVSSARLVNQLAQPGANFDSLFAEWHTDKSWLRQMEAQRADLEKSFEAMRRTMAIGDPAATRAQGVGGLSKLTTGSSRVGAAMRGSSSAFKTGAGAATTRDVMRQYSWVQSGKFLQGVHVMTGLHVPQTFRLSEDSAPAVFDAALQRARGVVDDKVLASLRDDFYAAAAYGQNAKVDRFGVLNRFNQAVEHGLAVKHGVDPDVMKTMMAEARKRRGGDLNGLIQRARAYRASSSEQYLLYRTADDTFAFTPEAAQAIAKSGGVLDLGRPILESQLADTVSLLDTKLIDRAIGKMTAQGLTGMVKRGADNAWQVTDTFLNSMNHLWKFSALFRLSYPARVQMDSQARLMAEMGPMRYLTYAAKGVPNTLYNNFAKVDSGVVKEVTRRFTLASRLDDIERELASAGDEARDVSVLLGEADKLRQMLDTPAAIKLTNKKVSVKGTEMQRVLGKRMLDRKTQRLTGDETWAYQNIGEFQQTMSKMDARANIIGLLTEGNGKMLRDMRGTRQWDRIGGDNPQWAANYLRLVNRQVREDQVGRMIIGGASDDEILRWLDTDAAGRAYWRGLAPSWSHEPTKQLAGDYAELGRDAWLRAAREHVETLVPTDAAKSLAVKRSLTFDDVKEMWPAAEQRPIIPAEMISSVAGADTVGKYYQRTQEWWFKYANDIPEQMMARHPFYQDAFKGHMQTLIKNTGVESKTLTLKQVNALRQQASILARKDVSKVMFDTSKSTNLGYHMRFMSPFYAAWHDTMTKWSRLMGTHLEIPPIAAKIFAAPNSAGLVVDKDGNMIDGKGNVLDYKRDAEGNLIGSGDVIGQASVFDAGTIILPLPSWLKKATGQQDAVISKGSLNVIFQGDPFWLPGPGPMVQVPVNEVLTKVFPEFGPRYADTPVGRYLTSGFGLSSEASLEQASPSWVRNLWLTYKSATDTAYGDRRFDQAYVLEYQSLLAEVEQGLIDPMELEDLQAMAANRTRNKFILQFLGSYVAPVSTRTSGRMQFYLDTWHQYQQKYGLEAYEKFAADYPEYTDLAISLSANTTGIQATIPAWESVQQFRPAIAKDPQYGWSFAGPDNLLGEFDSNVYALQGMPIGHGNPEGFRSNKNPLESIRQNQETQGWNEYWKISEVINQKLDEYGLTINQKAAEPLAEMKKQAVLALAKENPTWGDAYNDAAGGKGAVQFMSWASRQFDDYPELAQRSDWQTLASYMEAREIVRGKLEELGVSSIDSQTAKDSGLADLWHMLTAKLVASDIGFSQMWTRGHLESDDLSGSVY